MNEKCNKLFHENEIVRSEILALCEYVLTNNKNNELFRVNKNFFISEDSHIVFKEISLIEDISIWLRERKFFHHFKNGKCSCQEFF